jgi:hypothetical protein
MSNDNSSSSSGVGFFGLLFIVLLALKLGGVIDWSWWWVFAPLWIVPILAVMVICFFGWLLKSK